MSADPFNAELLSAYLDDEVTDAERALVEERLADDPAAGELLRELQSASAAVRGLPRERVDGDFTGDVLAAIENEAPPATISLASAEQSLWQRPGVRRGLVWASLAAAACLMLVVTQGDDDGPANRRVAQAPPKSEAEPDGNQRDQNAARALGAAAEASAPKSRAALSAGAGSVVGGNEGETAPEPDAPVDPPTGDTLVEMRHQEPALSPSAVATAPPAPAETLTRGFGGGGGGGFGGGVEADADNLDAAASSDALADDAPMDSAAALDQGVAESIRAAELAQDSSLVYRVEVAGDAAAVRRMFVSALEAENVALRSQGEWPAGVSRSRMLHSFSYAAGNESSRFESTPESRAATGPSGGAAADGDQSAVHRQDHAREQLAAAKGPTDRPAGDIYMVSLPEASAARLVTRLQQDAAGAGPIVGLRLQRGAPAAEGGRLALATPGGALDANGEKSAAARRPTDRGEAAAGAWAVHWPADQVVVAEHGGSSTASPGLSQRQARSGVEQSDEPAGRESTVATRSAGQSDQRHVRLYFLLEPAADPVP